MHRRSRRLLGRALIASVPALALALAFGPAAGASTAGASPAARAAAAARTALEHLAIGQHGSDQRVSGPARKVDGLTQVQSTQLVGLRRHGQRLQHRDGQLDRAVGQLHAGRPRSRRSGSASTATAATRWSRTARWSSATRAPPTTTRGGRCTPPMTSRWSDERWRRVTASRASVVRSGTSYTLKVTDSTHTANSFTTTQTCSGCANSQRRVDRRGAERLQRRLPAVRLRQLDR